MIELRVIAIETNPAVTVRRRELLQRDPPILWAKVIDEIRRAGYTTSHICLALNVPRSTLWRWECCGSPPNYEDGRAVLKLHSVATAAPNPMTTP